MNSAESGNLKIYEVMYKLHRMSDRRDTLAAVGQLIQRLCSCEGAAKIKAIYEMREAGALQTMLSALPRCAEWPEVEFQISKAISVMVTYEDDWGLLQRNAFDILSALHTFHTKSYARCRAGAEAAAEGCAAGGKPDSNSPPRPASSVESAETAANVANLASANASGGTSGAGGEGGAVAGDGGACDSEPNVAQQEALLQALNDQLRDDRGLISASIAKLTLVLCAEWGKAATPLGFSGSGVSGYGMVNPGGPIPFFGPTGSEVFPAVRRRSASG